MNKWVKRGLYAATAVGLGSCFAYAYAPKPAPVDTVTLDRGPLRVEVEADGRTRVRHRFVISAPVPGNVARIDVRPGDPVKRGETLALLNSAEPPLLDARSRAQAESQVRLARASRAQAEARVDVARAALEHARVEVERQRTLVKSGSLAQASLDATELELRTREREHDSAKLGVEMARHELTSAEIVLRRAAGGADKSDATPLLSPIDGMVLRVHKEEGGVVPAGTPLLEVGDPSDLEVVIDLLSTDAVAVKPGSPVIIDRWGGPGALAAGVRRVEPSGFTKLSALGVEEQRVNVIVDFVNPPDQRAALGDQYRVEARVVLVDLPEVTRVPLSALFRDGEKWAVFAVEGDHVSLKHVSVGHRSRDHAELLGGLDAGARVVVHPGDRLRDGLQVKPKSEAPAASGAPMAER